MQSGSMKRGFRIIIPSPLNNLEAAFEAGEATPIEIQLEALPRVDAAEIEVAEDHPSQVGEVSNTTLAGGDRRIERDTTDDPDEVLHFYRKEKVEINDPIGIDKPVSQKNPVNSG